jgi:hypothetical protein
MVGLQFHFGWPLQKCHPGSSAIAVTGQALRLKLVKS